MYDARPSSIWTTETLRLAIDAAGVALWSWDAETDALELDDAARCLWDIPDHEEVVTFECLSARIHPADRTRVSELFHATHAVSGSYEIDFRIVVGEAARWISARGHGQGADSADMVSFGVFLDVTDRKQAEESNELLAGEMSHRVKNLLAIASGLTTLTWRTTESAEDMARQLTRRLIALGRAHDLVRPVRGKQGEAALLGDLFAILLTPYDEGGAFDGRIRIAVPRVGVGEQSATTLALVVHELATNSLKYGALSAGAGLLDVSCDEKDDDLTLRWCERGGPEIADAPSQMGFGSRLVERSVAQNLGGSIQSEWYPAGVTVTLNMSKSRLAL